MYYQYEKRRIVRQKKSPCRSLINIFLLITVITTITLIGVFLIPHDANYYLLQLNLRGRVYNDCKKLPFSTNSESSSVLHTIENFPNNNGRTNVQEVFWVKPNNAAKNVKNATQNLAINAPNVKMPHVFTYTINEDHVCGGSRSEVFMLIYVHTDPRHFKQRMLIRETWGSSKLYSTLKTVVVFMMGLTPGGLEKTKIDAQVRMESQSYRDIVQENFVDTYRNLTHKALMALKWTAEFCPQASYILKTDDDVFVNIFNFVNHVNNLQRRNESTFNTIGCFLWENVMVQRNKKSKWYVSKDEYSPDNYGKYCSGLAFLMTGDLPAKLFHQSLFERFFWIDDFFVTGLLAKSVGAVYRNLNSLYTFASVADQAELLGGESIVFGHLPGASITQRYNLWREIEQSHGVKETSSKEVMKSLRIS